MEVTVHLRHNINRQEIKEEMAKLSAASKKNEKKLEKMRTMMTRNGYKEKTPKHIQLEHMEQKGQLEVVVATAANSANVYRQLME
eukprot:m.81919 g.81919  ORF g.81919 m.81919 type:complete len:85 (-) comp12070_c1_seq3:738-992(-)